MEWKWSGVEWSGVETRDDSFSFSPVFFFSSSFFPFLLRREYLFFFYISSIPRFLSILTHLGILPGIAVG